MQPESAFPALETPHSLAFPSRLCTSVLVNVPQIEAKIFELQEAMAERGYSDAEIEAKVGWAGCRLL